MNPDSGKVNIQPGPMLETVVNKTVVTMQSAISGLVLLSVVFFIVACQSVDDHGPQTLAYESVWSQLYPASLDQSHDTSSLQGHFMYAVSAQSLDVAIKRWSAFLGEWKPEDGYFEDGMQARLVSWAELEIQRTQHLEVGNVEAAREVDDELRKYARLLE